MLQKKPPGYVIILHLCTKNLDHIIYSSWGIECDRVKLVIIGHFLPFIGLFVILGDFLPLFP